MTEQEESTTSKSPEEAAEERRRRIRYALVLGGIAVLILVLWIRYAATQRLIRDLDSRSVSVRADAARQLLAKGVLEDSLPAQPVDRRAKTAAALAAVGTKTALEQLEVLIKDPEDKPQQAASQAFGTVGGKAMPYLIDAFNAPDVRAKKAAVKSCGMIGAPAIKPLTKALSNKDFREYASIALGQVRTDALAKARRARGDEKDELLRVAEDAAQPLLEAAQSRDKDLRRMAITVLGDVKDNRGVPYALKDLHVKGNIRAAVIALGMMADPRATSALVPFLYNDKYSIDAATALGKIGDPAAVPALLERLRNPETQFHQRGVWALQRIGKGGVPYLVAALKSDNIYERRSAAEALYRIDDPASVGPLVAALANPDDQVRMYAARALGWDGNAPAVGPLLAALADPSWRVTDAAATALAEIGETAIGPLISQMKTKDQTVAYMSATALADMANIGRASPGPALIAALRNPDPGIAKWAAVTLGNIGDEKAAEPLRSYLKSASTQDERWVASEALRKLGVTTASM